MAYSIKKGYQLANEGLQESNISSVEILIGQVVTVKNKKTTSDIIQIDYQTKSGKARGRYFPSMVEESPLGQVVLAINGEIPDIIEDLEEFLMNEKLIIEVKHNKSKSTERMFANVVNTYPLERYDEEEEEEYEEEYDLETDEDLEEGNPDDDLEIDDLSNEIDEGSMDWDYEE